jgi:Serpin (serine protease inhibitor)
MHSAASPLTKEIGMSTNIEGSADTVQAAVSAGQRPVSFKECNQFTARWCAAAGDGEYVLSGACTWPLLLLLESAAAGRAEQELAAATGLDSAGAQATALRLVDTLATPGVHAAIGLWARDDLPLDPGWLSGIPDDVIGRLTGDISADQHRLNEWASGHTDGLIPKMPVRLSAQDLLVLATALMAKTSWRQPFRPGRDSTLARRAPDLNDAMVLTTPRGHLTRVVVRGDNTIDVHLIAGEADASSADVLAAAVHALDEPAAGRLGHELPVGFTGPALTVTEVDATGPGDQLVLQVPRFELRSNHDLTKSPDVFGLSAALDASRGHFPKLSPAPLAVGQAASSVTAIFSATGFEAAAVTAVTMISAAVIREQTHLVRQVQVRFDRPFGFVAVHRPTQLALVAGWVTPRG